VGSDRVRFERWFRAHHAAVYRFAYRRVGADLVDDVVAETFLTAWRRRDELVGDPLPWLLGVARRVCGNCLRSRTRWTELVSRLARERMALDMAVLDEDVRLGDALRSLSSVDREALILVAWDGLSHAEAAIVVGTNTSAFTVRVHRARTRLAQALGDPGEPCETNLRQAMGTHE
jgi:RNA polymerase sigma-70 factor (ECF subfamily)